MARMVHRQPGAPRPQVAIPRLASVLLLAALGSQVGAVAPPGDPAPGPPGSPGEVIEFTVSLGLLPEAARVRLETLPPAAGRRPSEPRLLAEVRSGSWMEQVLSFHYHLLSTVRTPRFLPIEASRRMEEDGRTSFQALTYRRVEKRVLVASRAGGEPLRTDPIAEDTRDITSALYFVRSLPPGEGARFTVYEDGRLYRVQAAPASSGPIEVPAGAFHARAYHIRADGGGDRPARELTLWISEDPRRLPLKLTAASPLGLVVAELRRVRPALSPPAPVD